MAPAADGVGAFVPGPRLHLPPTATGPLDGLTFVVKDLIDLAGGITGGGNPDWAARQQPATASAPAVRRLLAAGATCIGKTVTDELAFSLEGENAHYGTPVNPRCPDRLPGGSSSGSAVAVAAGLADLGLGTDTGGSVRVPASFCGLWGFRPSHGRVPLDGVIPFAPSFDTVGLLASSAPLLRQAGLCLLASSAATMRPRRVLLATDAFALADPPAAAALRRAAAAFGRVEETEVFAGRPEDFFSAYGCLQGLEIAASLAEFLAAGPRFGPTLAPRFASALALPRDGGAAWKIWRMQMTMRLQALLPPGTILLLPAAPGIAPLKYLRGDAAAAFYKTALTLCAVAGLAGLPALSLPVADLDGCPLGLSVLAGPGEDEALLDAAVALATP